MPKPIQRKTHTKGWLRKALLELIQEKDYSDITIQEITDRADTARVTFYRNYGSKEELLLDSLEHIYTMLLEQLEAMNTHELAKGTLDEPPMIFGICRINHINGFYSVYKA